MLVHNCLSKKSTIKSEYLNEEIYNLLDETFTFPNEGFDFNIFDVSKEYIARPDLISLDAYGDSMYTDVICKLNGISNPFELNEGMKIILPTPDYINKFTHDPIQEEINANETPSPKSKKETRAVNDAVVGDSRFKIDPTNGVIIY